MKFKNKNIFKRKEVMKKMPNTVDNIKQKIMKLKGQVVDLHINRGRRKVSTYRARIENVYASVFTVKSLNVEENINTYSYKDLLWVDVKINNENK